MVETKFAAVNQEHSLLLDKQNSKKLLKEDKSKDEQFDNKDDSDSGKRKLTPTKSIYEMDPNSYITPLENYENVTLSNFNGLPNTSVLLKPKPDNTKRTEEYQRHRKSVEKSEIDRQRMEMFKKMKKESLQGIAKLKRQMAEIEIQAEELNREVSIS